MTSEEYIGKEAPRWYIVLLRLFMACYFIFVGVWGLKARLENPVEFSERFERRAAKTQVGRSYLNTVVEPIKSKAVFTWLLVGAPLLLGLSLLLGVLTRLSTFLGVLFALHYYLIKFHPALDALLKRQVVYEFQPLLHLMEIAALAVLFFAAAGRTFGLDGIFWRSRIRARFEPPVPEEVRVAAARTPAGRLDPIPLAQKGPARIEETIGHFPPREAPKKPPVTPGPVKVEPQTKPEPPTGETPAKPEPGQEAPPQQ